MKLNMPFKSVAILAVLLSTGVSANAAYISDNLTLQGFGSTAFSYSDSKVPFNGSNTKSGITEDGSFKGTKFGINIASKLSEKLSIASQFLANEEDSYALNLDWAFVALKATDWLTVRVGKIKYPFGLINEFVDVGYAYNWVTPPQFFYSEYSNGASATRESYTGYSLLFEDTFGDFTASANIFGGSLKLSSTEVRKLTGVTLNLNWDDMVTFMASKYSGVMFAPSNMMMNGKRHSSTGLGVKVDWNNFLFLAESADIVMEDLAAMTSKLNYASVAYKIGKFTPHFTAQAYKNDNGSEEMTMSTAGIRYDFIKNAAFKLDFSKVTTVAGSGFFDGTVGTPAADTAIIAAGVDFIF